MKAIILIMAVILNCSCQKEIDETDLSLKSMCGVEKPLDELVWLRDTLNNNRDEISIINKTLVKEVESGELYKFFGVQIGQMTYLYDCEGVQKDFMGGINPYNTFEIVDFETIYSKSE